jgi:hypothetical protein
VSELEAPKRRRRALTPQQKAIVAESPQIQPADVVDMIIPLARQAELPAVQVAFICALYAEGGTLHRACHDMQVSYRQGQVWMYEDPEMRAYCQAVDTILVEALHHSFFRRANDPDQKQPAYSIFALKSREPRYSERPQTPVAVQVTVTNRGRGGATVEMAPVAANAMIETRALTA